MNSKIPVYGEHGKLKIMANDLFALPEVQETIKKAVALNVTETHKKVDQLNKTIDYYEERVKKLKAEIRQRDQELQLLQSKLSIHDSRESSS